MKKTLVVFSIGIISLFYMVFAKAGWVDASSYVELTQTRQKVDRANKVVFSDVTIKNIGGFPY